MIFEITFGTFICLIECVMPLEHSDWSDPHAIYVLRTVWSDGAMHFNPTLYLASNVVRQHLSRVVALKICSYGTVLMQTGMVV